MKALVTGGGGFLGGAVVRMLLDRGDAVRSFSRGNYPVLSRWGVEQIHGDLADPLAVEQAVRGCDIVYHVAAKAGSLGYSSLRRELSCPIRSLPIFRALRENSRSGRLKSSGLLGSIRMGTAS